MFRIKFPSPMAFVERRLTPRRGDGGTRTAPRGHRARDFGVGYGNSSGYASSRRDRDFGVGYGNSSGYASNRRYTVPESAYFRCV